VTCMDIYASVVGCCAILASFPIFTVSVFLLDYVHKTINAHMIV